MKTRCTFELELDDEADDGHLLALAIKAYERGEPFVLASDGTLFTFLSVDQARPGYPREVCLDCITPGQGLR